MIEVHELSKQFMDIRRGPVTALDAVSFDVQPVMAEKLGYVRRGGLRAVERIIEPWSCFSCGANRFDRSALASSGPRRSSDGDLEWAVVHVCTRAPRREVLGVVRARPGRRGRERR